MNGALVLWLSLTGLSFAPWSVSSAHGQSSPPTHQAQIDNTSVSREVVRHVIRLIEVYDPDTQAGIEGVEVIDKITGNSMHTSASGHVALVPEFVKPTGALLLFRKLGRDTVGPIFVDPGVDTTLLVPLPKSTATLAPMITTEKYRIDRDAGVRSGFEQRCNAPHISCFHAPEIHAHPNAAVYDLLIKVIGVVPVCNGPGTRSSYRGAPTGPVTSSTPNCLARMHRVDEPGLCDPNYYINGFRWTPMAGTSQAELDQVLDNESITGIEVYTPEQPRPLRFSVPNDDGRSSGCGVVAIWTK